MLKGNNFHENKVLQEKTFCNIFKLVGGGGKNTF